MMRKFVLAAVLVLMAIATVLLPLGTASATTIDFNALSGSFPSYTESGVTFTSSGGGDLRAQSTPIGGFGDGSVGIIDDGPPYATTRADIAGGATFVSVDLGDYGLDSDQLFLEAYDLSNVLLDSTTFLNLEGFAGTVRLSVSTPDIAYAIFGAVAVGGSSVFADNFTFAPIPEPNTALLLSLGLTGLAAKRRRSLRS